MIGVLVMLRLNVVLVSLLVCGLGFVLGHAFTDQYPVTVASAAPSWMLPSDDGGAVPAPAVAPAQQKASKSNAAKTGAVKPPRVQRLHTPRIHTAVSHLPVHHAVYVPHPRVARAVRLG